MHLNFDLADWEGLIRVALRVGETEFKLLVAVALMTVMVTFEL